MRDNSAMDIDIDALPDDPKQLKKLLGEVVQKYKFLEEQFRIAQHKQFGKSTEGHPDQGELFNEAEELLVQRDADTPETESISYTRNKSKRKPLPKDLPREVVMHDVADEDKQCDCCGGELHRIGEDRSEKLKFISAKVSVIEHVRPKYACRVCDKDGTHNHIKQAPMPKTVIPKGYATPSLLSQIITSKYQFGLPLYRQEAMFKQYGIELSRKTMSDWVLKCADVLQVLYDKLKAIQLEQPQIYADEKTLNVVSEDKTKCYMWLYATGADSPDGNVNGSTIPNIVLFDYRNSRSASCAIDFVAYGQHRASNELSKKGVFVSRSGVSSIWVRHNLENFKNALKPSRIK